jgi:DNA-binding transcriptional regulator LsrR (DeoR family)
LLSIICALLNKISFWEASMPRASQPRDPRLLAKVSRLYYEQQFSEAEIAVRLHLSRPKVSRLLKDARQAGIVQIMIVPPPGIHTALETELEQVFQLQEAIVVEAGEPYHPDLSARSLGVAAARHLQESLQPGEVIGISWGKTLSWMVSAIRPQPTPRAKIVQIIGGLGQPTANVHATDLSRRLAGALGCELALLPAPGIMDSRQSKEAVLSDSHIQHALSLFKDITVAYVGIGAPTPDSVLVRDGSIITRAEIDQLVALGAVGDIALRFFDAQGDPLRSELDERVIGITLDELRHVDRVVGVAGGPGKLAAVRGALLGGYIDVLITDQRMARLLLEPASDSFEIHAQTESSL